MFLVQKECLRGIASANDEYSVESHIFRKLISDFTVKGNWLTNIKIPTLYEGIATDCTWPTPVAGAPCESGSHLLNFCLGALESKATAVIYPSHTSSLFVDSYLGSQKH